MFCRAIHNPSCKITVQKLFEDNGVLDEELGEVKTQETGDRVKNLCRLYQRRLRELDDNIFSCAMAFRKGKSSPEVGTVYFMVFATTNLSLLNNTKTAMQKINQEPGDCFVSDHFGESVQNGRKTKNEEEAEVIFKLLKDEPQPMALGEVKRIILEETPFPYHARALRVLEKEGKLTVVPVDNNENPMIRNRMELGSKISYRPMDPDTARQKFCNWWRVTFQRLEE